MQEYLGTGHEQGCRQDPTTILHTHTHVYNTNPNLLLLLPHHSVCYFFDRYTQSHPPPPTIIFSCSYLLLYLMITNSLNGISSVSNKYTEFNFFLQLQTQKCVPNVVGSGDTITIYVCLDSEFARFESLNVFDFYLCTNDSFQK